MATESSQHVVCRLADLDDPGSREFRVGDGDWPFRGFVVRRGDAVFAYRNFCVHAGHPLNWRDHEFLTADGGNIICASHGAIYEVDTGRCAGGPCRGRSLERLDARIEGGRVIVNLGGVNLRPPR